MLSIENGDMVWTSFDRDLVKPTSGDGWAKIGLKLAFAKPLAMDSLQNSGTRRGQGHDHLFNALSNPFHPIYHPNGCQISRRSTGVGFGRTSLTFYLPTL